MGVPEPTISYQNRLLRIFISHLATEKTYAASLQKALLRDAIESFVAHSDIEPAAEWQNVIEAELRSCDALVALLHPDFHNSAWTDQEMGFVMGRDAPVFTVRLGQTPYGFVGRFQAFQGIDKQPDQVASELFQAYRKHPKTKMLMRESLLRRFEKSRSYAWATESVGHLEEIDTWQDEYRERILDALKTNGQISGAYGVKDRVLARISQTR
jgi:TIR domain